MPTSVFVRARWTIAFASLAMLASMVVYPGGTLLDPRTRGYSVLSNFLSDLGMTVAYGGRSNLVGAILFVVGLTVIVVGLGGSVFGFLRLYSASRPARRFAIAAASVAVLVCMAFMGVALTPENRVLELHVRFTFLAFRMFPLVPLLFLLATLAAGTFRRRVAMVWAGLAIVLGVYVIVLHWGPSLDTPGGLMVQVVAQKSVAVSAVVALFYLTLEAERRAVVQEHTDRTSSTSAS